MWESEIAPLFFFFPPPLFFGVAQPTSNVTPVGGGVGWGQRITEPPH